MVHTHLYTEEDNINLSNQIEEVTSKVIENDLQLANDRQVTENVTNKAILNNDELYNEIKDIFEKDKKIIRNNIYFTLGKGKRIFNIDDTVFTPAPIALISSKRFEELYMKQLESFIYTDKDSLDTDKLFMLIYLFNYINKNQYPITITSNKNNKLRNKIVKVLNMYFNKNYSIIASMSTMVTSFKEQQLNN